MCTTNREKQIITEEQILSESKLVETALRSSENQTPIELNEVASWLDSLEKSED